jgi:hypothetical protein
MVSLIEEVWLLFLLALAVSLVLFPIVFVVSFAYGGLCKKYPGIPKVIWMFACILVSALVVLAFIEAAAGSIIFQAAGTLAS